MTHIKKILIGNWKMNGLRADGLARAQAVRQQTEQQKLAIDMVLCPPATLVQSVAEVLKNSPVAVGGQDCHAQPKGAFTGDVSAPMLADAGCRYVILGHSERRQHHGETDAMVHQKALAAVAAGLIPIVCVGETQAERDAGQAFAVVEKQIRASVPASLSADKLIVAYEPVWAIGTGRVATPADIADMHAKIRSWLGHHLPKGENVQLLYGGSVKAANAVDVFRVPHVDGALVGGASLIVDDFMAIALALHGEMV